MALDATSTFSEIARSGTASPMMLLEMRPTTHYAELANRYQWLQSTDRPADNEDDTNVNGLNLAHQNDELRLAPVETTYYARSQLDRSAVSGDNTPVGDHLSLTEQTPDWGNLGTGYMLYNNQMSMIQTFKVPRAFRLKALRLGIYASEVDGRSGYRGKLIVRVFRNVGKAENSDWLIRQDILKKGSVEEILLGNAEKIAEKTLDFANDEVFRQIKVKDENGQFWIDVDFREEKIWLPGDEEPLAFTVEPQTNKNLMYLKSSGSSGFGSYSFGQLYRYRPGSEEYELVYGDLAFQLRIDGFADEGECRWELDLQGAPDSNSYGEFEIVYTASEELGTRAEFWYRRKDSSEDGWIPIDDGDSFEGRFLELKVKLTTGEDTFVTPSVYLIRAAIKRRERMLLASRSRFGYPNCVAEAPDYSAEGNPLTGEASTSDTSRVTMFDPSGMISRLFSLYRLKNDEIKIFLGFDDPRFKNEAYEENLNDGSKILRMNGDWLPFKSVWIEDWQPSEGMVTVHCYDQQVRFKQAEAPQSVDPPGNTEEIHLKNRSIASIKKEFLQRARIRENSIDKLSLVNLDNDFPLVGKVKDGVAEPGWKFKREILKPTKLQSMDAEINRHLLAFQIIDENGCWVTRYVNFDAEPLDVISGNDILASSERYYPGMKSAKNVCAVFFAGSGNDETKYEAMVVSEYAKDEPESFNERAVDKLFSQFIPYEDRYRNTTQSIAVNVARRRKQLQYNGLRTLEFSTRLDRVHLQIGDHIHFESKLYKRAGAVEPNPLLVMITRKNIDRNLGSVHWSAIVLRDSDESIFTASPLMPPGTLTVTDNQDLTAQLNWDPSPDYDSAYENKSYEVYRRLSHLEDWGAPIKTAHQETEYLDNTITRPLIFDYAVRFVADGRRSDLSVAENVDISDYQAPEKLGRDDWAATPGKGCINFEIYNFPLWTYSVRIYQQVDNVWEQLTVIRKSEGSSFIYYPSDQTKVNWGLFSVVPFNRFEKAGERSDSKLSMNMALQQISVAPEIITTGGYPYIVHVPVGNDYYTAIKLKIRAPSGEEDLVDGYRIFRRHDNDTGGLQWSEWEKLPDCVLDNDPETPSPLYVYHGYPDPQYKAGRRYQFKCCAYGRVGRNGLDSNPAAILMISDGTPPDQPEIWVTSMTGKNVIEIDKPTQNGGIEECYDFAYSTVEGRCEGGEWQMLDEHYTSFFFTHNLPDGDLGKNWEYRVTSYDTSGNSSNISEISQQVSAALAGTSFLNAPVNQTLARVDVNASNIELRVEKNGVINAINVSTEGVDISGSRLTVDSGTVFTSDVEIQGLLKSVMTDDGDDRIELAHAGGAPYLRLYNNGHKDVEISSIEFEVSSIGTVAVSGSDILEVGGTYGLFLSGWGLYNGTDAHLQLPNWASRDKWYQGGSPGFIGFDNSAKQIGVRDSEQDNYLFTPDQNGTHISDASHAQTDPTNLTYAVDKQDFDYLVNKFNAVLALLENANVMASS